MTTLEQKRAAASAHRGVTYDHRSGKFFARIMTGGHQKYLGYFDTAEEAGAAYRRARENEPVTRGAGSSNAVSEAYEWMLENATRDAKGYLIPEDAGFLLLDAGQSFTLERTAYRPARKGSGAKGRVFLVWRTECVLCGAACHVMTSARARHISGITRTCEKHRGWKGKPWSLIPGHPNYDPQAVVRRAAPATGAGDLV